MRNPQVFHKTLRPLHHSSRKSSHNTNIRTNSTKLQPTLFRQLAKLSRASAPCHHHNPTTTARLGTQER